MRKCNGSSGLICGEWYRRNRQKVTKKKIKLYFASKYCKIYHDCERSEQLYKGDIVDKR